MLKRCACSLLVACLLLVLPVESSEAAVSPSPVTDPWKILEQELQPAFDWAQQFVDSISDLPAQVWRYCAPDRSSGDDIEEVQELFDCLGTIPYAGIAFDTVNATYSLTQGNWGDAAMRAVFIVPIVGNVVALKIVVKSRKATSITVGTLEQMNKSVPNLRLWRLPKHSDTVSYAKNVEHHPDGLPPIRHLRNRLKREAGVPKAEFSRWNVDHSIAGSLGGTNNLDNLRVLTVDANQVKSKIEAAVVTFKNKHRDQVVDFVVDHGTKARRPDQIVVKVAVNGREPITVTIPNVHGAASRSTVMIPGTVSPYGEAWRLAGAIQSVFAGSGSGAAAGGSSAGDGYPAPPAPTLTIIRAAAGDRCAGCHWMTGRGSGWAAGERFHVRCSGGGEAFADTSTGLGTVNGYRARFASPSGEIQWDNQICYSAYSETRVEVWNASGQRVAVTVSAGDGYPAPPAPTLTIIRAAAGDRCAGCHWMTGRGSGWAAGERFHVRCSGGGEAFADTSTGLGTVNGYRARFASPSGEIQWDNQICYSAYSETRVEVWNAYGQRVAVTVR